MSSGSYALCMQKKQTFRWLATKVHGRWKQNKLAPACTGTREHLSTLKMQFLTWIYKHLDQNEVTWKTPVVETRSTLHITFTHPFFGAITLSPFELIGNESTCGLGFMPSDPWPSECCFGTGCPPGLSCLNELILWGLYTNVIVNVDLAPIKVNFKDILYFIPQCFLWF